MIGSAALVDEELGQFEVTLLAGGLVQLDQGQLDLFVAGNAVLLAGSEHGVDVVGQRHATSRKVRLPVAR